MSAAKQAIEHIKKLGKMEGLNPSDFCSEDGLASWPCQGVR